MSPADREALLGRYRDLVQQDLPAAAARDRWTLRANHCFGRVLLDAAVGASWPTVLGRGAGAAFRRLDDAQLRRAVALGERMLLEGDGLVRDLDARSLRWRGKPPKRTP